MKKASVEVFKLTIQQWGQRNQLEDQCEWKGKKGTKYTVSDGYLLKILGKGADDEEEVFEIL